MRSRSRQWFLAWRMPRGPESLHLCSRAVTLLLLVLLTVVVTADTGRNSSVYGSTKNSTKSPHNESRGVFSPRMNYEQWTPLGMGDPLKNDPTYDYVPPVLERVHYWVDSVSSRKSDTTPRISSVTETSSPQQKTEILILGVSSKKPSSSASNSSPSMQQTDSRKDYESFFKYVDSPKYNIHYQKHPRPQYIMVPSPSHVPSYYTNKNRIPDRIFPKREPNVPYTFLMPPPIPTKNLSPSTQTITPSMATSTTTYPTTVLTSTSEVTVQESNLVFHSTSVQDSNRWREEPQQGSIKHHTINADSSSHITWRTPHPNDLHSKNMTNKSKRPAESYMHFQQMFPRNQTIRRPIMENVKIQHSYDLEPIVASSQRKQILSSNVMHKGLVTDEAMDPASTYVNIGKAEAQMDSSALGISGVSMEPPKLIDKRLPIQVQSVPMRKQVHTLQMSMQTIEPPPQRKTYRPLFSLQALLQKEATSEPILINSTTTTSTTSSAPQTTVYVTPSPATSTTTTTTLTTDPLFRHYKQPSEPIRGPMYLIIQGHSKVKTYGPVKQIHGINIQETNEIQTFEDKGDYQVKHLHHKKMQGLLDKRPNRGGREYPYNLQSLRHVVQTNLGAIDVRKYTNATIERRRDDDVKETELVGGYDVSENATTEKYHRGIVEKDELVRIPLLRI